MIGRFMPGRERRRLGFAEAAQADFRFVESEYGFRRVREDMTLVRYESDTVFLNVFHGRSSYEIGVELGQLSRPDWYVGLTSIVAALAPGYSGRAWYQASAPEAVRAGVAELARTVRDVCDRLLRGDEGAFEQVETAARTEEERATREAQFGGVLARADRAWEKKEWAAALDLYRRGEPALDPVRRRRVEFLRSRLPRS